MEAGFSVVAVEGLPTDIRLFVCHKSTMILVVALVVMVWTGALDAGATSHRTHHAMPVLAIEL